MQSLYLTEYIGSEFFLTYLQKNAISFEVLLSDVPYTSDMFPQYSITNKPPKLSLLDYRVQTLSKSCNPLIILHQLPVAFVKSLLEKYAHQQITLINLYPGMGGFGKKITPELDDLASIPTNFALYEPLDLVNFHDILSKRESKYLRIPHQHFPESIFSVEDLGVIDQQLLTTIEVLSLKSYGYAGDNATLLASAANFSTALQAGTILQEQSTPIDIFIISKLNADWNAEIISSLKTTKKLIVMIDHQASKSLQYLITTQLQKHVLNDIEVIYFTPEYEKLTTIFDEFAMEQTGFDAERLVSCFLSDCTSRSPAGRRGGGGIGPRYQSNITIP